jgi:glycopeptide antibiotics resistance protein
MSGWETFKEWFMALGDKYNVNPYIFGGIYLGAIPFFFLCLAWTIKNIKRKKPFAFPLFLTALCFISAYLYLLIVGQNIPVWVYVFIGLMIVYGVYSTLSTIKKKLKT